MAAVLLLTARFYSTVDVPAGDRAAATQVAANILHAAGIDIRWTDCNDRLSSKPHPASEACLAPVSPDEVIVRFVRASPPAASRRAAADTLGDAYVDTVAAAGSLATVYVDRVANLSRASGVDAGTLLGRVMAHEIGHLLLGTATHRPSGLMRAEWSTTLLQRRMANEWRFSTVDAADARDGVLRRSRAVRATAVQTTTGSTTVTIPCLEPAYQPWPATCPKCPVCTTVLPADRAPFHLLVEPAL